MGLIVREFTLYVYLGLELLSLLFALLVFDLVPFLCLLVREIAARSARDLGAVAVAVAVTRTEAGTGSGSGTSD